VLMACRELDQHARDHASNANPTLLIDAFELYITETCALWTELARREFQRAELCMPQHCLSAVMWVVSAGECGLY
jgi:hypothetical protein